MPPKRRSNTGNVTNEILDLNLLFQTDDINDDFFGFDVSVEDVNATFSDLRQIFNTSDDDSNFAGFNTAPSNTDLNVLFLNDTTDSEFLCF